MFSDSKKLVRELVAAEGEILKPRHLAMKIYSKMPPEYESTITMLKKQKIKTMN